MVESKGLKQQRRYSTSSLGGQLGVSDKSENGGSSYVSETESIRSILVRTGVFRGETNETSGTSDTQSLAHKDMIVDKSLMKPNYVSDNVFEAVKLVYQIENFS